MEKMSRVQDQSTPRNAWELDRQLEIAMDAMRLPPGDAEATTLSGGERRRVALCKTAAAEARLAAARRADEPPRRRSVAWLEHHLQDIRARSSRDARSLLPRQRRPVDSRTRPRPGHPVQGQLLVVAGAERSSGWKRKRSRNRLAAKRWRANSNGQDGARGAASPRARPASAPTKSWPPRNTKSARTNWRSRFRPGRTWAIWSSGPRACSKALRRQSALREPELRSAARRHRRHHRPQRRRQDDAVPHDHRPGKARRRQAARRRHGRSSAYVDQNRDALDAEQDRLRGNLRRRRFI